MTSVPLADGGSALIMLVDDNPTNRYVLGTYLRRAGHEVVEAEDGAGALALLRDLPALPETAVVDVRLPDMTGFEVCEAIKSEPRTAALPVIHVSASAISTTDRAQGLNRGADAYLTEPVAPNELIATVAATLRYARARKRAETLAARLSELNRATMDFYRAENTAELAARTALGATRIYGGAAAVVVRSAEDAPIHVRSTGDGETTASADDPSERFGRQFLGRAGQAGAPVRLDVLPAAEVPLPAVPADAEGTVAVASAQVKGTGSAASVLVPGSALHGDGDVLSQLAHACALSVEALRSYRQEHTLALTLQRTFLPVSLPRTSLADLAVRYLPANRTAEIGGDFYEALTVPDGLLLAVGDVAGHSLDAAVVMGELRHALRAYALEGHAPDGILTRLDNLLYRVDATMGATVCVAVLGGDGTTLRIANAGHLPPLLREPDGTTRYVTRHGPMLGLQLPHPPAEELAVRRGSQIVMVTDGLVERRGTDLDSDLGRMADVLAGGPDDVEEVCELMLRHFPPDGRDDVALLTARIR
ncbi:fused response regulator/phosphatase [Actinacidiphila rubida]|uniref:Response regulator receiver domain-containing protein n=1 Tax=Actinacidiphila rubida TaxID=310780 RepID=A0A1H8JLL0_9ACTN|nr:fused response regulator/phosphatase [Actinacidiphila rubida]SEN81654.1 Response regulator receiver domain-containing protein [Actinacidiphila rubida]